MATTSKKLKTNPRRARRHRTVEARVSLTYPPGGTALPADGMMLEIKDDEGERRLVALTADEVERLAWECIAFATAEGRKRVLGRGLRCVADPAGILDVIRSGLSGG